MANKKRGRPLKHDNIEELEAKINKYFDDCDNNFVKSYTEDGVEIQKHSPKPYTITGLAYSLGMYRSDLLNYQSKDGYKDIINKAKMRCEMYAEEQLFRQGNCTGVIFNLKNNYGYKDKQEIEADVSQNITVIPPKFD